MMKKNLILVFALFILQLFSTNILANAEKKGDLVMIANGDHDTFIEVTEDEFKPIADDLGVGIGGVKLVDLKYLNRLISQYRPIKKSFGGSAANTGYTLAAMGKKTAIYAVLSDEELSKGFIKNLESVGMKNYGAYLPEKYRGEESVMTQLAAFITDPGTSKSERTFIAYKGLSADFSNVKFDLSHIKDYKILYIEGYVFSPNSRDVIFDAINIAKQNNVKVLFSPSSPFFVDMYKEDFEKMISKSDIIFTNRGEVAALYKDQNIETALKAFAKRVDVAIVTNGNNGSAIYSDYGKNMSEIYEPLDQSKAIDTTGAGDGYLAGFLLGYLNKLDMEQSAKMGAVVANHIVQEISGRPSDEMIRKISNVLGQMDKNPLNDTTYFSSND